MSAALVDTLRPARKIVSLETRRAVDQRTRGDALIVSHAFPYSTVGEFEENISEVRAYTRTADKEAPNIMMTKFEARTVERTTGRRT